MDKSSLHARAEAEGIPAGLVDQITASEGLRLTSYRCPTGHVTIGWGHNLEARPVPGIPCEVGAAITSEQADRLLMADLLDAHADMVRRWPWAASMDLPRKAVLWDMVFNMGVGRVGEFTQALHAMRTGDYPRAAQEMLDSRWAFQVGDGPGGKLDRAERLARQMTTGKWEG